MITNWRRVQLSPSSLPGNFRLYQNVIYHGDPTHPEVGDVRVWFEMAGRAEPGHQDKVRQAWVKVMLTYFKDECSSLSLSLSLSLSPDQHSG